MNNKANKVIGIVLYSIAGLLLIYTGWALIHSMGYIEELIDSGQLAFAGNEYDIVSFYMSGCAQYALFAIVLIALGWMVSRKPDANTTSDEPSLVKKERDEEELDDWFDESNAEGRNSERANETGDK